MSTAASQAINGDEGGFLALMRHRNYALIWTGQLVSQTGDRMQWVAISLWVYALTGSALSVSYAIMALLIGPALVGLYAGAIVDRVDRRKILIAADLVRAALVFLIPRLMSTGQVFVYIDLFLVSAASAFFRPAMLASIPQSVPKSRLLPANSFFASMDTSTEVYGPALAGLLVARFGYVAVIYLNAVSYMVSAVFVSALRLPHDRVTRGSEPEPKPHGTVSAIREGLRYIRSDRLQAAMLAVLLAGHWVAGLNSLQTPLAIGVLGVSDSQFGWFQSIWGMGFVLASLLLGWYGGSIPRGPAIVFAYLLWALATGIMGMSANYGMLVVAGFWVGFANMLVFINVATVLMEHTPDEMMGRVISTRQVALAVIRVVALLGFGWLADFTSVRTAIVAMALISFLGTLAAAARFPVLRGYLHRAMHAPEPRVIPGVVAAPEASSNNMLARYLAKHVTPEFTTLEQRQLNAATILIVFTGWLALVVNLRSRAFALAAVVIAAILMASLVRFIGRRLGLSPEAPTGDAGSRGA